MSDILLDATTRHNIWLQRYASYLSNQFDPVLNDADKIIRDVLSRHETIDSKKQLDEINKELKTRLAETYGDWIGGMFEGIDELIESENAFNLGTLEKATEDTSILSAVASVVAGAVFATPTMLGNGQSVMIKPLMQGFTPKQVDLVLNAVTTGFKQQETVAQITKRIRGMKRNNYKDGVLAITKRSADLISRTQVNHVANQAKMEAFWKNRDILSGWVFVATLDMRTTNICRYHDQKEYRLKAGPVPPLHANCRSTISPVIKDKYSALTISQSSTRASKGASGGQQTSKSPYYNWLATQPKSFQQEVLGIQKTELFRKGGLSNDEFRRLTSNNLGQPLTLKQIQAKNPEAWEQAGLDID